MEAPVPVRGEYPNCAGSTDLQGRLGSLAFEVRTGVRDDLPEILRLHKMAKATLGHLPNAAFEDRIHRGHLLIAERSDRTPRTAAAYVMFDLQAGRGRCKIVHLSVEPSLRRSGLARQLVQAVRDAVSPGPFVITLTCRRDYEASELWPRLGFVAEGETKTLAGNVLTRWVLHLEPDLFTLQVSPPRVRVAPDLNIVYDLCVNRATSAVTRGALDAVGVDDLEMIGTATLLDEVTSMDDRTMRHVARSYAGHLRRGPSIAPDLLHDTYRDLASEAPHFLRKGNSNDVFDLRHATEVAAGAAEVLLTRDGRILRLLAGPLRKRGVVAVHPDQLVAHLHNVEAPAEFLPTELMNSDVTLVTARVDEEDELAATFVDTTIGERTRELRQQLAGERGDGAIIEVLRSGTVSVGLCVSTPDRATIRMLRVRGKLGPTAARFLAARARELAAAAGSRTVTADSSGDRRVREALVKEGYRGDAFAMSWTASSLEVSVHQADLERALGEQLSPIHVVEAEKSHRPAKIVDGLLPTIVPIQARYAEDLLDGLASQGQLLGRPDVLCLTRDNVYFRSRRNWPIGVKAPARILWLVTQRSGTPGVLVATSILERTAIGTPEQLHRRHGQLGVLSLDALRKIAKAEDRVMALRFTNTELLPEPVRWPALKALLNRFECPAGPVQSPRAVPTGLFETVWTRGQTGRPATAALAQALLRPDDRRRPQDR